MKIKHLYIHVQQIYMKYVLCSPVVHFYIHFSYLGVQGIWQNRLVSFTDEKTEVW